MRFFERQDRARRQSLVLILLFLLAVALIILAVAAVVYVVYWGHVPSPAPFPVWFRSEPGWMVMGTVAAVVTMGSLHRYLDLRRGGERVARMAGAQPVAAGTEDPLERQLRNVTEEMALASGVTVPQLFVMQRETAINAFVAGYQPNEAAMVVTRGALEQLSRDELQGVVAHEFSHILNGDMRINIRLISMLAGILLIGQLGQYLVVHGLNTRRGLLGGRGRNEGVLILAGGVLVVVGYVGLFMGRVIKAGVSRQREYLADAAAVQFTRNPEGIGGALYRIGVANSGSRLTATGHAEDLNHLCFGESVSLARLLASHPPIEARLNAIDGSLLVRMKSRDRKAAREQGEAPASALSDEAAAMGFSGAGGLALEGAASVGQLSDAGICHARSLLATLPGGLNEQLHGSEGAVHLCLALALEEADHGTLDRLLPELEPVGTVAIGGLLLRQMIQTLHDLGPLYRVPLVELSLPALRELDDPARQQLLRDMERLIREERGARLHDIAILGFLKRHLGKGAARNRRVTHRRYGPVMPDIRRLLWVMASAGARTDPRALYREAMAGFEQSGEPPSGDDASARGLLRSLGRIAGLPAMLKPAIIDACVHCIQADGRISLREYELLRIIADQLDCPMPPLPPSGESGSEQG